MRFIPALSMLIILLAHTADAVQFVYLSDQRGRFSSSATPPESSPLESFGGFAGQLGVFEQDEMRVGSISAGSLTGSSDIHYRSEDSRIVFSVDEIVEVEVDIQLLSTGGRAGVSFDSFPLGRPGLFRRNLLPQPLCISGIVGTVGCVQPADEFGPAVELDESIRVILFPTLEYHVGYDTFASDSAVLFERGQTTFSMRIVPEPGTAFLIGGGLVLMARGGRRGRAKNL